MRGYKAIAEWAKDLKPKARERFGCRHIQKRYVVPSESIFRDVLVRARHGEAEPCGAGAPASHLLPQSAGYASNVSEVRVDPAKLDLALQQWNAAFGEEDQSLAIDGKTMCNAIDEAGQQTHIPKSFWQGTRMSVVGHETSLCVTQKSRHIARSGQLRSQANQ